MNDEDLSAWNTLCGNCAADSYLKQLIVEYGEPGACSECEDPYCLVFTSQEIAEKFVFLMRDRLDFADELGKEGDDLEFFVSEFLGQDLQPAFLKEIVEGILSTESFDDLASGEAFWNADAGYKRRRFNHYEYESNWGEVHKSLQHENRFFSDRAKELFNELFGDIEQLNVLPAPSFLSFGQPFGSKKSGSVVTILPTGHVVWRARSCNTEEKFGTWNDDPLEHVGPPPARYSRAGRMNADGVVVLYCAEEQPTCLAELRPSLSAIHAVIQLRTTKPLRLLDFRKLTKAREAYSVSDFHPRYEYEVSRRAFLREIHGLISQPIAPGRESEYLITQVMSEYLAHVYKPRFDGIIFNSAQRYGGTNYVIFGSDERMKILGEPNDFPIEYVDGSIEFFRTSSVEYSHIKQTLFTSPEYEGFADDDVMYDPEIHDLDLNS